MQIKSLFYEEVSIMGKEWVAIKPDFYVFLYNKDMLIDRINHAYRAYAQTNRERRPRRAEYWREEFVRSVEEYKRKYSGYPLKMDKFPLLKNFV